SPTPRVTPMKFGRRSAEKTAADDTLARLRSGLAERYAVDREIGRGAMACVFVATDSKHARKVAIKVLHPELSANVGADRFVQEIRTAARLLHPHIVALFDSGEANGLLYYIMPFVGGESLREVLDRHGRLPLAEAVR